MAATVNTEKTVSPAGLDLIKQAEGLRLKAYLCPAGQLTIGYGHVLLVQDGQLFGLGPAEMAKCLDNKDTSLAINTQKALWLLQNDTDDVADHLNAEPYADRLNQNQFDALADFIFNLGYGNFKSSTLRKKLQAGDFTGAAAEFDRWVYARVNGKPVTLAGLVERRAKARKLFETPMDGQHPVINPEPLSGHEQPVPTLPAGVINPAGETVTAPLELATKPWWQSKTILGVLTAIMPTLLKHVCDTYGIDYQVFVSPYVGDLVTLAGGLLAVIGRKLATTTIK